MGKRIKFDLSNFRAGIHTEPSTTAKSEVYLKELKNLVPNPEGQLVPRRGHTIEFEAPSGNVEGMAFVQNTNGQGFILYHTGSDKRLCIMPVIEGQDIGVGAPGTVTELLTSAPGLERELSVISVQADLLACTTAGSDTGYWILLGSGGSHASSASEAQAFPLAIPRPEVSYTHAEGPVTVDAAYWFDMLCDSRAVSALPIIIETGTAVINATDSSTLYPSTSAEDIYDALTVGDMVINVTDKSSLVVGPGFSVAASAISDEKLQFGYDTKGVPGSSDALVVLTGGTDNKFEVDDVFLIQKGTSTNYITGVGTENSLVPAYEDRTIISGENWAEKILQIQVGDIVTNTTRTADPPTGVGYPVNLVVPAKWDGSPDVELVTGGIRFGASLGGDHEFLSGHGYQFTTGASHFDGEATADGTASKLYDSARDWRVQQVHKGDLVTNTDTDATLIVGDSVTIDQTEGAWIDFGADLSSGTFEDGKGYLISPWTELGSGSVGVADLLDRDDRSTVIDARWIEETPGDTVNGGLKVRFLMVQVVLSERDEITEVVSEDTQYGYVSDSRPVGNAITDGSASATTGSNAGAAKVAREVKRGSTGPQAIVVSKTRKRDFAKVGDVVVFDFSSTSKDSPRAGLVPELDEQTPWGGLGGIHQGTDKAVGAKYGPPDRINNRIFKVIENSNKSQELVGLDGNVYSAFIPGPARVEAGKNAWVEYATSAIAVPDSDLQNNPTQTFCLGWMDGTPVDASQWAFETGSTTGFMGKWNPAWSCLAAIRTMKIVGGEKGERWVAQYMALDSTMTRIWTEKNHPFKVGDKVAFMGFSKNETFLRSLDWDETGLTFDLQKAVNQDPTGTHQKPGYYYYCFSYQRKAMAVQEELGVQVIPWGSGMSYQQVERYVLAAGGAEGRLSALIKDYRDDTGTKTVITVPPGSTIGNTGANFMCVWRSNKMDTELFPSIVAPGTATNDGSDNPSKTALYDSSAIMDVTFERAKIGHIIRNITDGSEGIISSVNEPTERSARTIVCNDGLHSDASPSDADNINTWKAGDRWEVVPAYADLVLELVEEQPIGYYGAGVSIASEYDAEDGIVVDEITRANPGKVITVGDHNLENGDVVRLDGIDSMPELNYTTAANLGYWVGGASPEPLDIAQSSWNRGRTWRVAVDYAGSGLDANEFHLLENEYGSESVETATKLDTALFEGVGNVDSSEGAKVLRVGQSKDFDDKRSDEQKHMGPVDTVRIASDGAADRALVEAAYSPPPIYLDTIGVLANAKDEHGKIAVALNKIAFVLGKAERYKGETQTLLPVVSNDILGDAGKDEDGTLLRLVFMRDNRAIAGLDQLATNHPAYKKLADETDEDSLLSRFNAYRADLKKNSGEAAYPWWEIVIEHNKEYAPDSGKNWGREMSIARRPEAARKGPPAGMTCLAYYNDRVWVAGYGAGVRFSHIEDGDPEYFYFPPYNEIFSHNGHINTLGVMGDNVLVMGGPSVIGRLTGTSAFNFDADWFPTQSGPMSVGAWTQDDKSMFYVSASGVHVFDGTNIQNVSGAIIDKFRESAAGAESAAIGIIPGKELAVCFSTPGSSDPPKTFVLDMKLGTWREIDRQAWQYINVVNGDESRLYYNVRASAGHSKFIARWRHGFEGIAGALSTAKDEISVGVEENMEWLLKTQELDWREQGLSSKVKRFDFATLLLSEDSTCAFEFTVDGTAHSVADVAVKRMNFREFQIPIQRRGRRLSVKITGTGDIKIEKMGVSAWA